MPPKKFNKGKKKIEPFWVHLSCPTNFRKSNELKKFFKPYKLLDIRPGKNGNKVAIKFEKKYVARQAVIAKQKSMKEIGMELIDESKHIVDQLDEELKEKVLTSGRLFIRHLPFNDFKEEDLRKLFEPYGFITDVSVAYDGCLKRGKGFGFVTFMVPLDAVKARNALHLTEIKGRKIYITAAEEAPPDSGLSTFVNKKKSVLEEKKKAFLSYNWNSCFLSSDTIASIVAHQSGLTLAQLYQQQNKDTIASQLPLAEIEIVSKMRDFLLSRGYEPEKIRVKPMDFVTPRSEYIHCASFIWKDLEPGTTESELLTQLPTSCKEFLTSIDLLPFGVAALLHFSQAKAAKKAFTNLANGQFKDRKILLQWVETLDGKSTFDETKSSDNLVEMKQAENDEKQQKVDEEEEEIHSNKLIIRNVPFNATEKDLAPLLASFGTVAKIRIPQNSSGRGRGFAFVDYDSPDAARKAKKEMVSLHLLGRRLVVEFAKI